MKKKNDFQTIIPLSRIDIYYLKQTFVYFIGSSSIFVLLFVLGQVRIILETISLENMSFFTIIKLLILTVPMHLFISMPVGLNLANALTFGYFAINNELLALKSFGFKIEYFIKPVLILALLVCALTYIDMDFLYPYTYKLYLKEFIKNQVKTIESALQEEKVIKFKNYELYVDRIVPSGKMKYYYDVIITESGTQYSNTIYAKKGFIDSSFEKYNLISLTLLNGSYSIHYNDGRDALTDYEKLYIFFNKPSGSYDGGDSLLMTRIDRLVKMVKQNKKAGTYERMVDEKLHFKIGLLVACFLFAIAGLSIAKGFPRLNLGIALLSSITIIMLFYSIFILLSKTLIVKTKIPIPLIYYPLLGILFLASAGLWLKGSKTN